MIGLVREWILGIVCAAMILALAEALTPKSGIRKAGRLAGGLLLMLAVVKPVAELDYNTMSGALSEHRLTASGYTQALEEENLVLMKGIIEEQTAAYISDKAAALGMDCTAQVAYHYGEDGETWPESVLVRGIFTQQQQAELARAIEAELAIPNENQTYERLADE